LLSPLRNQVASAETAAALARAADAADAAAPEELLLADLQDARAALEEVTGKRTADDVLQRIFERFCIGK
ncbi:MAG: tRNA uridine-5-carboxymethylaminomethyl(34) synthesis GTPase MnmE, partial [Acidobacteria bacterium]|nr:tRNA uridine-5-carboxymethylaminomethyl(34) synthesis GTPase MnmE [Acidobacteriota bacterium]